MKKTFNFRSAIVCVLVLIMCLTAFVACNDKKDGQDDLSGLAKAKDYVFAFSALMTFALCRYFNIATIFGSMALGGAT